MQTLVALDLETTGLGSPIKIVQIAALKIFPDGKEEILNILMNPGRPIEKGATAVHGIKDEDVKEKSLFRYHALEIEEFFKGADLAGYNSKRYDATILKDEFTGMNMDAPFTAVTDHIDVQEIYFHFNPRRLEDAYKEYTGKALEKAHDALSDAKATFEVLKAQLEKHELPQTVNKLSEMFNKKDNIDGKLKLIDEQWCIYFGKNRGKSIELLNKIDPGFIEWVLGANFSEEVKNKIREIGEKKEG